MWPTRGRARPITVRHGDRPKRQRVGAYAVILRDDRILLSRLVAGGHQRRAVDAARRRARPRRGPARRGGPRDPRGDRARPPRSARPRGSTPRTCPAPGATAGGSTPTRCGSCTTGGCRSTRRSRAWSRSTAPPPRRPGCRCATSSTARCRWRRWCSRRCATTGRSASSGWRRTPWSCARRAAVLLTRISARGFHTGSWTLPGGGVDHGESPRRRWSARCVEECGVDLHGRRAARRPRRALQRHRPVRAARGLPRGPPRLRGRPSPDGRRAAGGGGRRHHRRGRLGAAGRDRAASAWPVLDVVRHALDARGRPAERGHAG